MAKTRVYKRRHPERTDYYRIIESRFEELERMWPECFEHKYGYLRKEVMRAIFAFLDCGIPENGVARFFCDGCGRDYFLPFSCRQRGACPSCSTKRSILFGEKICELVRPISHLHVTFTIPKILRAWFRRNRKLLKLMVQSANWAIRTYFIETLGITAGCTGGIYCVHSHGKYFNHHPHVHALVPAGIMKDGVFHELKRLSSPVIAGLFRARLLKVLLEEGVIRQQIVDLLLTWNHHSGFNVHARGRISGADRKAIENVARYMSRAALSVQRVKYNRAEDSVTVTKKPFGSSPEESRNYPVGEFMALLASHIPAPYESLTYYYGVYSSSHRGKQRRENKEDQETELVLIENGKASADCKSNSSWARLIRRIFEVDPLRCKDCGAEMRLIAFVTDFHQVRKILEHIGEPTIRPPPLAPNIPPPDLSRAEAVDYIPDVEVYVQDPIYPD